MRRKLAIISSLFIALAIIIAILFISLMPSISPDDIIISGIIKEDSNIGIKYEAFQGKTYYVEVYIDSINKKPLISETYFSFIYPCINDNYSLTWLNKEQIIDKDNLVLGNDIRTSNLALKKLINSNISVDSKSFEEARAFAYKGNKFPIKLKAILDDNSNINRAYLVFCHYERKWGKDLSWTKLIPIHVE